jgi:hypothetical protein
VPRCPLECRSLYDALAQQLEQAKWQARKWEKKAEELQASWMKAEQVTYCSMGKVVI